MTHAYAMIPNFSVPLAPSERAAIPFHADPILEAIDAHEEAWSTYQVALPGQPSIDADAAQTEALTRLLGTACATREGAFCLLRHLRWFLTEEERNADVYDALWRVAQAREADLTLLLGCDGIERLVRIPAAMPSGRLPAPLRALPAPTAIPTPQRTPDHSGRFLLIGEAIGALVLIAGGCLFSGIASLI